MNQPSPVTAAPTPAAPPSLEERQAAVMAEAMAEAMATPDAPDARYAPDPEAPVTDALTAGIAVETAAGSEPPVVETAAPVVDAPVVDVAAEQRAAERRARLAELSAKTREQVDRKAALAQSDRMARDLAAAQARADAAEKAAAGRVDMSSLDEGGFFALAEARGIKPEALSAWMQKAITSPEKVAEAAALKATQSAYDPKLKALEDKIAAADARIEAYEKQMQAHASAAEEQRATQQFLGMVKQSTDRAPLAARLLAADSNEFLQMASVAAERVAGLGPEALLDALEEMLHNDVRKAAQTYAALYGPIPSQTSAPVQPTIRGAAKPNTVSNSLAQSRTTLVEEQDFARLPIEERAAILKRS